MNQNLLTLHKITKPDTYIESATERYNRENIRKEQESDIIWAIKVGSVLTVIGISLIYIGLHLEVTWL